MPQATPDPYQVLGVAPLASAAEIKAAYRALVKQHHPDTGGDDHTILELNAAWEVLGDVDRRRRHDQLRGGTSGSGTPSPGIRTPGPGTRAAGTPGSGSPGQARRRAADQDSELGQWLQLVYAPIDRLLGQVINPFPAQLRALSADPYDDQLMEAFCAYLEQSQARLEKVVGLYRSRACPASAQGFGLSLYHCLSQVQDALAELERYTMGYVDGYLHDGREMLREAKRRRSRLQEERRRLDL